MLYIYFKIHVGEKKVQNSHYNAENIKKELCILPEFIIPKFIIDLIKWNSCFNLSYPWAVMTLSKQVTT